MKKAASILVRCVSPLVVLAVSSGAARAQASAPASSDDPAVELEHLVVSAGRIQVGPGPSAAPGEVLTAAALRWTGVVTNVQEALRTTIPQFMGNENVGADNANTGVGSTAGGSKVALRNLPTLVLINGRRAAVSPVGGTSFGSEFVDLNVIPLTAILAIEVLRDSGSALYGTDAIGGVVNIVLSNRLDACALGAFHEMAPGGWENRGLTFAVGGAGDHTRLMIAGGWSRQDPLWQEQRAFSSPVFASPAFGGVIDFGGQSFVLNPALAAPPVGPDKVPVSFPMAQAPTAPDGRPYFGAVGSDAVYWGKHDAAGAVVGFTVAELAAGSSPEAAQVAFNLAPHVTLLQRRENRQVVATFEHDVSERLTAFGDVLAARIETFSQGTALPIGRRYSAAHPDNPFRATVLAPNRMLDHPRQYNFATRYLRFVGGLKGQIGDRHRFETALNLNGSRLRYRNPGAVSQAAWEAATGFAPAATTPAQRIINPFQRSIPEEEVAASGVIGTATFDFESTLHSWDVRVDGELHVFPAGAAQWTIGVDMRRETLQGSADDGSTPNSKTGVIRWSGVPGINRFDSEREVAAVFADWHLLLISPEQRLAWCHAANLMIDLRAERCSDMPDSVVPRFALRWHPRGRDIALRASLARSFHAPTLFQLNGAPMIGSSMPRMTGIDGRTVIGQVQTQLVSNPELEPERARSWSVGVVATPARWSGLSLEVDYVRIRLADMIDRLPAALVLQDVELRGPESVYVAGHVRSLPGFDTRLERGFGTEGQPVTAPGQIASALGSVYLTNPFVNLSGRVVEALDAAVNYRGGLGGWGRVEASVRVASTLSHVAEGTETAGRLTLVNGTIPRWSTSTNLVYARDPWRFSANHRFISSVYAEADGRQVGRYQVFDLGVSRRFTWRSPRQANGLELSLLLKNAFDAQPRVAPLTYPGLKADIGTYNPLGRTWLLAAEYRY